MKTITLKVTNSVLSIALVLGLFACGGSKKASNDTVSVKQQGESLIEVYCTGPDYQSNKDNFRASAIGESLDQMVAKKKASTNARAELASLVQTTVKGTIDNYVNSTEMNNVEQVEERFESLTREVINQKLQNLRVICEKHTKTSEGKYKTYLAIEIKAADLVEAMNAKLSQDAKLKVDYDYEKFKKTFDEEMKKLEAKNNGLNY
jgi:predicted transcriptional regulator